MQGYLVVNTDELSTLCTAVGKVTLITFYTEGIVFFQDISEDGTDEQGSAINRFFIAIEAIDC